MPLKKPTAKKPKKGFAVPPVPPETPAVDESPAPKGGTKKWKRALEAPSDVQQAVPVPADESNVLAKTASTQHEDELVSDLPRDSLPTTNATVKRAPKKKKYQHPNPEDVTHARTQLMQAISSVTGSASNARPTAVLPPPLQTRRAAKAAAQAIAPPVQEAPQTEAPQKPERPQPRPLPPGLRLSPDSDDGFVIPKHRAKVARALERFRAEDQPTNPAVPATHGDGRTGVLIPANPRKSKAPPPAPSVSHPATSSVANSTGTTGPLQQGVTASGSAVQTGQEPPSAQSQPHSVVQPETQSLRTVRPVPQKPASVVSPGGRHYSGLFPSSVGLTGPGILPPAASHYSARFRSTSPISAPGTDDTSSAKPVDGDNGDVDEEIGTTDEPASSPPPIQPPSDSDEARIIRLCIQHGLDPRTDYSKMARAYVAALKKHQAEEEEGVATTDRDEDEDEDAANSLENGGGGSGCRGGGGCNGGSGDDDGDGDDSGGDDEDGKGSDDDDRYGPEYEPWMIDPDTDHNQEAPCAYHFQTRSCAMRYYGPPPEFVGSNGEVECYTTYKWTNKPGASTSFQRIPGGFIAPRASIWQLADARREADRQRAEHIAAGLIQPHRVDDDDDSGSDYGATQQELKTSGKPVDSDLELESDTSSPVKSNNKGKGREVPAIPLTNKGKARAEPAIPSLSAQLDDKANQQNSIAGSSAGAGGRPSLAELAMCDALGIKVHKSVTDIGLLYGRRPEVCDRCVISRGREEGTSSKRRRAYL